MWSSFYNSTYPIPTAPHHHRVLVLFATRGLPCMTSAKFSDFLTASPLVTVSYQLILFLSSTLCGPPPPTHCGLHIWKSPNHIEIRNVTVGHSAEVHGDLRGQGQVRHGPEAPRREDHQVCHRRHPQLHGQERLPPRLKPLLHPHLYEVLRQRNYRELWLQ